MDAKPPETPGHLEFIRWIKHSGHGGRFVYLALDTRISLEEEGHRAYVAVKGIPLELLDNRQHGEYVKSEVLLWREMWHKHIVSFREVFKMEPSNNSNGYLGVVMNYIGGGTLQLLVKQKGSLHEDTARAYFQQIILVLEYLHDVMNIMHRDIKLENLLIDGGDLYLCDFSLAKRRGGRPTMSLLGTPSYIAPEILFRRFNQIETRYDGKRSDIWSCGVCLYCMLYGECPPGHYVPGKVVEIPTGVSEDCRHFLARILATDPNERADLQEIKEHKWFKKDLPKIDSYNDQLMEHPGRKDEMERRQPMEEIHDMFRRPKS